MRKPKGSGHYFGVFLLIVIALAVFSVSVTLSLMFFTGITPPDKPWFPYFGLSLTEAGFLCWLGAFLWVRHHSFHTAVEFIMVCLSLAGIVSTAGVELFSLMLGTSINVHTTLFANAVGMVLEAIFLANIVSIFVAAIVFYSEGNPGWFRGIAGQQQYYQIEEQRGEPARPLASRSDQPKDEPANLDQSAEIQVPRIEPPKPRQLKQLPPVKSQQQMGLLREGTGVLMDSVRSRFSRNRGEK